MSDISDIGKQVVANVATMFEAEETLRSIPDGIEWGHHGARQRLWWESPIEGEDGAPDLVRLRILTELAPLASDEEEWPVAVWTEFLGLSEDNLWCGPLLAEEMEGHLCLAAAVSGHEGNAGYLPRVLFQAMAAQAAVREALFESKFGGTLESLSATGSAGAMRELSDSFHLVLKNWEMEDDEGFLDGLEADFTFLIEQFQEFPCLMCNGDGDGLTAEFPFGRDSSLLRMDLTAEHPHFGPSICLTLGLPLSAEESSGMFATILELNRKEQTIHEIPWSLGSWYLDQQMSPRIGYRLWLPYALFQPNLLINLGVGMVARARHCCESIAGMSFEESYPLAEEAMVSRLQSVLDMLGAEDDETER
ncbi:hypothetical protein OAE61_04710 [Verrucomicrobiales bacterium]|nr:hypothetical protein [Verrucomicrobiales bacterium]